MLSCNASVFFFFFWMAESYLFMFLFIQWPSSLILQQRKIGEIRNSKGGQKKRRGRGREGERKIHPLELPVYLGNSVCGQPPLIRGCFSFSQSSQALPTPPTLSPPPLPCPDPTPRLFSILTFVCCSDALWVDIGLSISSKKLRTFPQLNSNQPTKNNQLIHPWVTQKFQSMVSKSVSQSVGQPLNNQLFDNFINRSKKRLIKKLLKQEWIKKTFFRERLTTKQKTQIEPEDSRPKHSITKPRYFT